MRVAGASVGGMAARIADKGHRDELVAFAGAVRMGGQWPNPLWQQVQATEIALTVEGLIARGVPSV